MVSETREQEQKIMENASYLTDTMDIDFTKAYQYAHHYPNLSKEDLIEQYLSDRMI